MVDIISLDSAKNLVVTHGEFKLTLDGVTEITKAPRGSEAAMKALVDHVKTKGAEIPTDVKEALVRAISQLKSLSSRQASEFQDISTALNFKPKVNKVPNVMAEIIENPMIRKIRSNDELSAIGIRGDNVAKLDDYLKVADNIKDAVKKGGKDGKETLAKIFAENHEMAQPVRDALTGGNKALVAASNAAVKAVNDGITTVKNAADAIAKIDKAKLAKGLSDKQIEALEKSKKPHITAIEKATDVKKPHGSVVMQQFEKKHPNLFELVKADNADLGKHMDSAIKNVASSGGKSGRPWYKKLFDFKRSEEWAKEVAVKENTSVAKVFEKHGAKDSLRWGKVGLGVAAVGAALYAATSIFGRDKEQPGKFAEAEAQRRAQNQGAGLGAA